MENLVNYAMAYASKGLSVIPCIGKKPLIKFADKPPLTADEIKKIWQKYPYANIALKTDKFLVVDIDRHENGADGFKSIAKYRDLFLPTLAQKTAGGGKQLLYLKREDTKVSQCIGIVPGVDIKAHHNNYVIVAPSSNHGMHYAWINHRPIATAPRELVRWINSNSRSSSVDNPTFHTKPVHTSRTSKLFETIVNGLGDSGSRNNNLTEFIGSLFFRGVGDEEIYNLALIANSNTLDPLSDKEVNKTFISVQKKEYRRRRNMKSYE
jgi:hypothetical protein